MKKCIHLLGSSYCSIYSYKECIKCGSREEDPYKYLKTLMDILHYSYSKGNSAQVQLNKKEIKTFCQKWGLEVPDLSENASPYEDLHECYMEDVHRGEKKGASEGNTNSNAKQLMNDNRNTKLNSVERGKIHQATKEWEEKNGALPKLSRSSMGRSKTDTYEDPQ